MGWCKVSMGTSRISPLCILHNGKCGICQNGLKWPVFPQNGQKGAENGIWTL